MAGRTLSKSSIRKVHLKLDKEGVLPNCKIFTNPSIYKNGKKESFEEFLARELRREQEEKEKKIQEQLNVEKKRNALGANRHSRQLKARKLKDELYMDDILAEDDEDNKEKFDYAIIESEEDLSSDYEEGKRSRRKSVKKKKKKRKPFNPRIYKHQPIENLSKNPIDVRKAEVLMEKVMLMETQKLFKLIPEDITLTDFLETYGDDGAYAILKGLDEEIQVTFNVKRKKFKKTMLKGDTFVEIFCEIARLCNLNGSHLMLSYKDVPVDAYDTPYTVRLENNDSIDCCIFRDYNDNPESKRHLISVKIQELLPREKNSKNKIQVDFFRVYIHKFDKLERMMAHYCIEKQVPFEKIQYMFNDKILSPIQYAVDIGIKEGSIINATFL